MKKFFTLGIAASLLLTVASVMAQDAQNPWHLVAFENETEVAFYNIEVITGIETTAQNIRIVLDNGKEFLHPAATTVFGFDPRRAGTATPNENITVPQWNVRYANGQLHFSETVNRISIYTLSGALVVQFAGNYTAVPVNLPSDIYVVQASGTSAKLPVNNNNGSAVAQPKIEAQTYMYAPPTSTGLRSENDIKIYWNIIANNTGMSIKISDIEKFSFKADTIVFTLTNGSTVELPNYQGIEFTIEATGPTTDTHWDLERTFAIGGGAYGFNRALSDPLDYMVEYISAVSQTDIIICEVASGKETKYSRKDIYNWNFIDLLYKDDAVICFCARSDGTTYPAISFKEVTYGSFYFYSFRLDFPFMENHSSDSYDFNGGTNRISTIFKVDKDGNMVASYVNADGVSRQHTFKK